MNLHLFIRSNNKINQTLQTHLHAGVIRRICVQFQVLLEHTQKEGIHFYCIHEFMEVMKVNAGLKYELQKSNRSYLDGTSCVVSQEVDLQFSPSAFDVRVCKCDTFNY